MTRPPAMDFAASCRLLFDLPRFDVLGATAMHPGLEKIRALLEAVGNPHEAYPAVHVAGTNGKGSVSSMVAAVLTASGLRTGLHTSPHLFSLAERLRVDGLEAEEAWVVQGVERLRPAIERVRPSFFEASTALAFLYFAEMNVDVAVIEVGMGGRLDATNIVTPNVAVITNIARDHVEQLGHTLPMIAAEKAGIIKPGVPVVTGACQPEVKEVITEVAVGLNAPVVDVCREPWGASFDSGHIHLSTPDGPIQPFRPDMAGRHQAQNMLVATAAARVLLPPEQFSQTVVQGLSNVRRLSGLRARCEIVARDPLIMVDVAHNEAGIRAALECLDEESRYRSDPFVMLGLAADKDLIAVLEVLLAWNCILMPIALPGDRGRTPSEIAEAARNAGLRIVEIGSPEEGLQHFREHAGARSRFLVAGSHYLVATLPDNLFPRWSPNPA